jgi:hypothetical protein
LHQARRSRSTYGPRGPNLIAGYRRPLCASLCQCAKDRFSALALLHFGYRFAHQVGDNSALVLAAEYPVELRLDVVRNTEIDRCHDRVRIVEDFNNGSYCEAGDGEMREMWPILRNRINA